MENTFDQNEKKALAPPYMSWKTFSSYVKTLHETLPPRIDKSAMAKLSGGNQNNMMNALMYLKLINEEGIPSSLLKGLIEYLPTENPDNYQKNLTQVLLGAYPFLFDETSNFNLEKSTSAQFDERFKALGISGETIKKCESFFLSAAQEAGLKISSLILELKKKGPKKGPSSGIKKIPRSPQEKPEEIPIAYEKNPEIPENTVNSQWYMTFKPAFDKLPNFNNPHWSIEERQKWINALSSLLDLYINIDIND